MAAGKGYPKKILQVEDIVALASPLGARGG
jgi:hypothetical protein